MSSREAVQGASVLDKLGNLANVQDQRVLALRAEENKLVFVNPRLDRVIILYRELLVSVQALIFDRGVREFEIAASISESQKARRLRSSWRGTPPRSARVNIQIGVRESLFDAIAGH
jgi:hypothetical protein